MGKWTQSLLEDEGKTLQYVVDLQAEDKEKDGIYAKIETQRQIKKDVRYRSLQVYMN